MHFLFFLFFFVSTQLFGIVLNAPNLDVLERYIKELDSNALVIFDVDYTLLVPDDRILAPCGEEYLKKIIKSIPYSHEEGKILHSIVMLQASISLIDKKIFNILNELKQKNIKTIALTAIPTGQFGLISNAEQWRVQQLASLGIYLDWSFPEIDSLTLEDFTGKSAPVFKKGVLASSTYPKGQVLCAFLKKLQWVPSTILFIDDKMDFINSVEQELEKENIRHISFYYTAARDQSFALDYKVADFQFKHLIQQKTWLNDEEAKNKLLKSLGQNTHRIAEKEQILMELR